MRCEVNHDIAKVLLKDPRASAWLLESRGITKDKRIIVACATVQQATGAGWAPKYLGFPDVVLHGGENMRGGSVREPVSNGL